MTCVDTCHVTSHDVCIDKAYSTCTLPGAVSAYPTARCTDGRLGDVLQLICIEKLVNDSGKVLQSPSLLPRLSGNACSSFCRPF